MPALLIVNVPPVALLHRFVRPFRTLSPDLVLTAATTMEEAGGHANNLKRPTDSGGDAPRKLSKTSQPSDEDFSTSVRKKLNSSSRTGQACDRCKVSRLCSFFVVSLCGSAEKPRSSYSDTVQCVAIFSQDFDSQKMQSKTPPPQSHVFEAVIYLPADRRA